MATLHACDNPSCQTTVIATAAPNGSHRLPEGWIHWTNYKTGQERLYCSLKCEGAGLVVGNAIGDAMKLQAVKASTHSPVEAPQATATAEVTRVEEGDPKHVGVLPGETKKPRPYRKALGVGAFARVALEEFVRVNLPGRTVPELQEMVEAKFKGASPSISTLAAIARKVGVKSKYAGHCAPRKVAAK